MINKADQIRELLRQDKTTREIANLLKVSLRDIHTIREQEGIDIGALERQKTRLEQEIVALNDSVVQNRSIIAQQKKQIDDLERKKINLEAEIEKKQSEIKYVQQPMEPIYFPQNYNEVKKYLETLSSNQLRSLTRVITDVLNERAVRVIQDARTRVRKDNENTINRMRNNLRL